MIDSPCVRNCCLDENDICLGCFRSIREIMLWNEADQGERQAILEHAATRRAAHEAKFQAWAGTKGSA
jgi:predicted Fe-S protein YdhL (DUF1289 family)